jgi:hypothetical protein
MSDPVANLRDRTDVLSAALEHWAGQGSTTDKATARRAASAAVDAIDALLRDLYLMRGRLVQEIRRPGSAARSQVA